jgi:glycosyltransferase involved in cell wall biosynthesis
MNNYLQKPQCVLITSDTTGSVWTLSLELARSLTKYDVSVALATIGPPLSAGQCEEAAKIGNLNLFESNFRLEWVGHTWRDIGPSGEWLLKLEDLINPDVVHLNGYIHGAIGWRAPTLVAGHSCALSGWNAVRDCTWPAEWENYRKAVARCLASADIVTTPTNALLHELQEHYGPLRDGRVIPTGRHSFLFVSGIKQKFVFAEGKASDKMINISALKCLAPKLSWPVVIAGDSPSQTDRDAVAQSTAGGNLQLLGRLVPRTLAFWLSQAGIYVLPARSETCGLPVLEAALAKCALVLGDIPGLREVWGDAAVFVPPDDVEALYHEIQKMIANEKSRLDYGLRAHRRALQFTPQRMADAYLDLYSELMARDGKASLERIACA